MRHVFRVMLVVAVAAGRTHAQPGDASALAEQLFNQARDLAKAKRWAEACPKFEASLRYDPVLGTRLNLATCYEHIGKLASAWGLYRESIELAKKAGDVKRRDYAQKQAAALEPRLPKLTISAADKPPAGFIVQRDGTQIDAGALGVALYVDAGPHEITASAPGFEAFTQTVNLVEGKIETLVIPNLKPVPEPPKAPIADYSETNKSLVSASETNKSLVSASMMGKHATKVEPVVSPSSTRKYIAVGLGAAGVAATGVGFLFGAKASSSFSDAKTLCGPSLICDSVTYDQGKQLMRDAHSSASLSTVLVASGGAAIVTGVIVFLTRPRPRERAAARVVPISHERSVGFAIMGSF